MTSAQSYAVPAYGIDLPHIGPFWVLNRHTGSVAVGDVLMFDTPRISAGTTNFIIGHPNSCFTGVVQTPAATLYDDYSVFVVAASAAATGLPFLAMMSGVIQANWDEAAPIATFGSRLSVLEGTNNLRATVAGRKHIAIALEAHSSVPTTQLKWVAFNGFHGWK